MISFKRLCLYSVVLAVVAGLAVSSGQAKAPSKAPVKIENTPAAQRLDWYKQHMLLKEQSPWKNLQWRLLGPRMISGRCTDVDVPKGSRTTIYVGAATGGVWKTVNAGTTWQPLFDWAPTLSIGDIAVSEADPNIVWVGTGEANIFRASTAGIGVYKSADAGKTWTHMGLAETSTIGRIVIHPANPDIVYVAASGHEWANNPDRGVYKTTDGGNTWAKVLFINERVGAIDLVMNPKEPETLIASTWNRIRRRWSDPVPGGEDGVFKTTDGGKTWKPLTNGLPDTLFTGRTGIDLCRTKPNVVYAFVDNHTPGREPKPGEKDSYGRPRQRGIVGAEIYRSDDGGESWLKVSQTNEYMERFGGTYGWVFGQIRVDPNDENTIYIMGLGLARSTDGGKSFKNLYYEGLHGDHHGLWIDPADSTYLLNVNDGGINASYDGGQSWRDFHKELPLVQFYNVSYDLQKPFWVYGSVQDHGTYRGLVSMAPRGRRFDPGPLWEMAPGGEGTLIDIDTENPNIIYSSTYYGRVQRSEYKDGAWKSVDIYPTAPEGEPPYRGQWLAGSIVSPHNPAIVYHGFQYLFRSMNRGRTWERTSPDLTYNNPQQQGKWPYAISFATISAIDESPFKFGLLYVGTDDGRVWVTRDGGEAWTEISAGLPFNKHVSRIVASKYDQATVYLTLNGRRDDDFNPYIFKSADYGKTWTSLNANIPGGPVNVIREDPKVKDVLYVGTDLGVYATVDGAKTWAYLGDGLPNCYVWDLFIHPVENSLVAATFGRGMWIVGSVSPLQGGK